MQGLGNPSWDLLLQLAASQTLQDAGGGGILVRCFFFRKQLPASWPSVLQSFISIIHPFVPVSPFSLDSGIFLGPSLANLGSSSAVHWCAGTQAPLMLMGLEAPKSFAELGPSLQFNPTCSLLSPRRGSLP